MISRRRQSTSTWAEDTALQRCNRSADSGGGVEGRLGPTSGSGSPTFNFNTNVTNLRGTTPRPIDTMSPPQLTNANQSDFQFTLNQDTEFEARWKGSANSSKPNETKLSRLFEAIDSHKNRCNCLAAG